MNFRIDEDIFLKELEVSDAQDIFNAIDKGREYLREWLPFVDMTRRVEDSIAFTGSVVQVPPSARESVYAILFEGHFAGLVGFKSTDLLNQKTEIGYWLAEEFQHKGIITRSCQKLIRFAFDELGFNRVQIKVAVKNFRSQRVAERLGCTREGVERDGELLINGFTDLYVYSLLKRDCTF